MRTKLISGILISMCASAAFAALGGDATTIQADQAHMRAQRQVAQNVRYTVHEMKAETGTTVHEFVSPAGKVFGVSWSGPVHPDMQQLLGTYYEEFQHFLPTHRVHGPLVIRTGNIVLESGGHQRALTGRAYIPAMVPEGVSLEEIH
ncbi:MAG: DUF2844 domain-containing protein [Acidobacteria bacterium]|nr:DUF2844 domain-containing protein [Acidobacteriota bacterium]